MPNKSTHYHTQPDGTRHQKHRDSAQGYAESDTRYPVVYLLHGHGDNYTCWINIKPELPQIASQYGFIVVCPDGKRSWYWDSPLHKDMQFETYISDELVHYIDSHYRTVADRRARAIAG